jgi:type I restriction enzyme S subunit
MTGRFPIKSLSAILEPIERPETPIPGHQYRQVGVRLWGEGSYERETLDGSQTRYKVLSRIEADDIIVNKIWARNGSVAVVSEDLAGCYVSGEFPTFIPIRDKLEPRWFHWFTKMPLLWQQCDEKSRGTSGKNRIRPERFLEIHIPLPPLDEQRRIVARIEELSAKIEEARGLRRRAVEEVEALALSGSEIVFQELVKRHGASTLGESCISITDGDHITPPFVNDGVRFIFVGNVSSGRLHFENCKHVEEDYYRRLSAHRVPQRDDILYSAVGATLGVPAIVDSDVPFCFQRHIAILKPDRARLDSRFAWHMLRSTTVFNQAWDSTTGSAQPTVPLRAIRLLPIPLPPISEQRHIAAYLDGLQAKVDAVKKIQEETAEELDALMPSILSRAFSDTL